MGFNSHSTCIVKHRCQSKSFKTKKSQLETIYPTDFFVGVAGFEPTTPCSQSRCANRTALHPEHFASAKIHIFCDFIYDSYRIFNGRVALDGLPAARADENTRTLEITLRDVVGVSIDKDRVGECRAVADELFAKADEYEQKITEVLQHHIYNQGRAGEVGANYLLNSLVEKRKKS